MKKNGSLTNLAVVVVLFTIRAQQFMKSLGDVVYWLAFQSSSSLLKLFSLTYVSNWSYNGYLVYLRRQFICKNITKYANFTIIVIRLVSMGCWECSLLLKCQFDFIKVAHSYRSVHFVSLNCECDGFTVRSFKKFGFSKIESDFIFLKTILSL